MTTKSKIDHKQLKATPEVEDFRGKYESGKIGQKLLDGYFNVVQEFCNQASQLDEGNINLALEIGCGEGYSTQRLKSMLPSYTKLEASEYVDHLIPLAAKLNPRMRIIKESIYDLEREDESLDLGFVLEVLEHLDFPHKAMTEVARAIRPGGFMIAGVPHEPLWRALNMARGKYWTNFGNTPGHLNHWTTRGFVKSVESNFGPVISVQTPLPWTIVLAQKS